ncbi:Serine/threonine-protein kinase PrkC [Rosistilla carotiformis]|uniref:non-specific serine/threonine protein kinase n=1 Tax=Rosistilla carotiformis TaxID=2528017 RepID=A0A518JRV3_9BACT|nr:serine/threonine-protein kinase [Rosistilla carotiformis]QDV68291.1 Serine/threonine-protein kinase PrkC [Rosistilla carotiformis]
MTDTPNTPSGDALTAHDIGNDLTGCQLGDLQILRRLGRGGMADVYLAKQVSLERQVAVKILRASLANDNSYVERFRREARAAAKLSHPNIVQVYDVGRSDGRYFISQEFVDGRNLREQIDREGPLSLQRALDVMVGVAAALDAASEQGITHRDIKPENIMLSNKGDVKVADFGLARIANPGFQSDLTQVGLTLGTPLYMSPEQVQGKPVDVRSDLYSLGVTMFHVMTGRPPFEGETPLAIAVRHLHEVPPRISALRMDDHIPPWIEEVVARLMAKAPKARFDTPARLVEYLQKKIVESGGQETLGTLPVRLAATNTLQSVMSAEPSPNTGRLLWTAALLLPLLGLAAGVVSARHRADVAELLSTEAATVEPQDTVQRQFFEAMRINTPVAWQAVWGSFPPADSTENKIYAAKARIQLARLYDHQGLPESVERLARQVMNDPDLPPHLTAIAMAQCENSLRGMNKHDEAALLGDSLNRKWKELSVEGQSLFRLAVPRGVLDRLDL